ncbi:MAG: HEAT repeat domain-containing protein, partial [Methanosarcinales archaeon]
MIDQDKIHRMVESENPKERRQAAVAIEKNFSSLPNKEEAWKDLIKLTQDKDWHVRSSAAEAIGEVFASIPNKELAQNDLHNLTQ